MVLPQFRRVNAYSALLRLLPDGAKRSGIGENERTGEEARASKSGFGGPDVLARVKQLPGDLHSELELARVVSRSCLSGVGEQRAHRSNVITVGDIENVGDELQVDPLTEWDSFRHSQIIKYGPRSDPGIAAQVAVQLQKRRYRLSGNETVDARFLKRSTG